MARTKTTRQRKKGRSLYRLEKKLETSIQGQFGDRSFTACYRRIRFRNLKKRRSTVDK